MGHIEKACFAKKKQHRSTPINTIRLQSRQVNLMTVEPLRLPVDVSGRPVMFEVDTGTCDSFITQKTWNLIGRPRLSNTTNRYQSASDQELPVLGTVMVPVAINQRACDLQIIVTSMPRLQLLGRVALQRLNISVDQLLLPKPVHAVVTKSAPDLSLQKACQQVCAEFPDIFKSELGTLKDFELDVKFKSNVTHVYHKPRPIPYAIQEEVNKGLEAGIAKGIWKPTSFNAYGTPIVPIKKKAANGERPKLCLCGDYSMTINPQLETHRYPIPSPEDLMCKLGGGHGFSKIDLADAYNQICLSPTSQKRLALSTHKASSLSLDCVDDAKCSDYGSYVCTDSNYVGWSRQHCRQYCGFCPKEAKSNGFYGKCFYKGREYSHSEKWDDGCDYECVCEDGETGAYRCYNKCPVYKNLPPECTLIAVPNDCCLKPVCDFQQKITSRQGSGKGYNPQGVEMCEYAGKQYYDGQSWEVGCDLRCTCTDAKSGIHVCQSYCPTYQNVPSDCKLTKKPGDCCATPVCEFETLTGIVTGDGSISGKGVGAPTPDRSCVDKLSDCRAYGKAACTEYPEWARDKCSLFCNACVVKTPTPKADDYCWHNGKQYAQNDTWSDACDTECTCEVAAYGYYRCLNKCPDYSDVPKGCSKQKEVGECCPVIKCDKANFIPSSTNVNSLGNGGGLTVVDPNGNEIDVMPTVPSNTSLAPSRGPRLKGCLFRGRVYVHGQQWEVGCNLNCLCIDANTGVYECRERCPKYENVPPTCNLLPDPSDPCCTYPGNCGTPYIPIPVYAKGVTNVGAVMTPSITDLIYGHYTTQFTVTFAGLTVPSPTPPIQAGSGYCVYKGGKYLQGEVWKDGCSFNCVCEDGLSGAYRCIEQCQHYVDLPPQYCHLETDPSNPCCMRPVCNFTAGYDVLKGQRNETLAPESMTLSTVTTTTTIAPPKQQTSTRSPNHKALCQYKETYYTEGQSWFDGCDYKCSCDKADENLYTCLERCPSYTGDFTNCTQISDPSDPQCCYMPMCQGRALPPGQFIGTNPNKGTDKCVYKGVEYSAGDVWEDGCQFQCECTDASLGLYQCTDKCPSYPNLPSNCKLVQDFASPCCKIPQCTPTPAPVPGISTVQTPQIPACDYFGAKYYDGQTWEDGCDYRCRCENATEGVYTCTQRCPSYSSLPFDCKLVTDDKDSCCEKPICTPSPNGVPTLAPGTIQGNALVPNPGQVPVPGQKPQPGMIPTRNTCIYNGMEYAEGDEWYDGCDYTCKCDNATSGAYTCVERCTRYPQLPAQCKMVKDAANPCCEIAVCDPNYSTAVPSTMNTLVPGKLTTMAPPKTTGDFCEYDGQFYADGQTWYDGCDYKCVCEDAKTGAYRCTDRCATQQPLPQGCSLIADPRDPICCEVPSCTYTTMTPGQKGTLIPSLAPAVVTGRQVTPSPLPVNSPNRNACVYNGAVYRQGQRWADGCDYNCECIDGSTGQYSCTEKCPQYASLPPQCVYVQDINNPCCKVPYCDPNFPTPPTLSPQNTLVPGINIDACVYNGVPYKQGDHWEDGCDLMCVCEDAKLGNYRCDRRCPSFDQVPPGCVMSTNPKDTCCQELMCQPGLSPFPYPIPVKVPGKKTGQTVNTNGNNNPKGCLYNGQVYKEGDSWQDRCDLKCTCLDEDAAIYQCTERCPKFQDIPQTCQLMPDPSDICCEVPQCFNGTNPNPLGSTLVPPMPGRTTLVPGTNAMCEYNGAYYSEGQQWYDGCDKVCVCLNASLNQQSCASRCVDYSQASIPKECQMVADPTDPACCEIPQCIPMPGPNGYPTPTPTSPGDPKPTPTVFVNIPGVVTGLAPLPTPTPDPNGGPTPALRQACVYKGQEYRQGMRWQDGCDFNCVCVDETAGLYKCDQRCPSYPLVPLQCQLTQDPKDFCCKIVSCDFNKPTPNPFVTPATATQDPNAPTPPTIDPALAPTPNSLATPPTLRPDLAFCVYKGVAYSQGSAWTIGCDTKCKCEDATTNFYSCADRCPTYMTIPNGCSKVVDPSDACCSIVECIPDPLATPAPNLNNTVVPNTIPTLVPGVITGKPGPGFTGRRVGCVHNGVSYRQGDVWSDGCAYNCECLDDKTGQYKCVERCPKFVNVPSSCSRVPDKNDLCCEVLSCLTPAPSLSPNASTLVPPTGAIPKQTDFCVFDGQKYTQDQVWYDGCDQTCTCENAKTNYHQCLQRCPTYNNIPPSCVLIADPNDPTCCQIPQCSGVTGLTGQVTGSGTPPTVSMSTLSPTLNNSCYYKGVYYPQGQRWRDGCDYNCVCDDGTNGVYTCTDICPTYLNTAACPMVRDPSNACCMMPDCSVPTTATNPGPSPGSSPSPVPTPYPVGSTLTPQKGKNYLCPSYSTTTNCSSIAIPGQCCPSLQCNIPPIGEYNPRPQVPALPVILPGPVAIRPTARPQGATQSPQILVVPPPGGNSLPGGGYPLPAGATFTGIKDRCIFDNRLYAEGEKWEPDCDLQCTCLDGKTGFYRCVHRCTNYNGVKLPAVCSMTPDARGCCQVPLCKFGNGTVFDPVANPQPSIPVVGMTGKEIIGSRPVFTVGNSTSFTSTGKRSGCVYKSIVHYQGDTWNDGCDYSCKCENEELGLYRCLDICPTWPTLPQSCRFEPNPTGCCKPVTCDAMTTQVTFSSPTALPPSSTSTTTQSTTPSTTSTTPSTTPSTTSTTTTPPTTPKVTTVSMVTTAPPTGLYDPYCHDVLTNCKAYGKSSCQDPYEGWGRKNCNLTCNFCSPSYTTTDVPCVDVKQCNLYEKSVCTQYTQWSQKNCPVYCGLCGTTTTDPPTPSTIPTNECTDKINCQAYGDYICLDDQYKAWVQKNCASFCGICTASTSPSTMVTSRPSWSLLMKGVAGVPGDLTQLWNSNSTLNPNNPKAMTLTPEFKEHFKSEKANQWDQCNFQEVKVSVLKNGVEEGNIVFDVRGLDKNSWFRPDRIVSSTWNDIRSNTAQLSLMTNSQTGRQFLASDSTSCTGKVWMFVSTSNVCSIERKGAAPRFFFSLSSSGSDVPTDQLGEGDVFAIFGHGGNCGNGNSVVTTPQPVLTTTPPLVCMYNGTAYNQDDKWAEGCAYECTCIDASKGRYVCNSKCPTYPNLQSTCKLITKPGECCQEPICNGFEPKKGCYYKGASYSEGAEWTDGCDFDCICANASTGDFKCKSVCPRWNLPSQCTLGDPGAGMCCPTPKCPFTWVPPADYVPR